MGRSTKLNEPSLLLVRVTFRLVDVLRTVTFTFCMVAPEASDTVPLMEPRVSWGRAGNVNRKIRLRHTRSWQDTFFIANHPSAGFNRALHRKYHNVGTQSSPCLWISSTTPDKAEDRLSK